MRRAALLFALALSLAAPLLAQEPPSSQGGPTGPSFTIYESELARCRAISKRLGEISGELRLRLADSEATLTQLEAELATSKEALNEVRARLDASETHSAALEAELTKAESSLSSLTESFKAYRAEAEAAVAKAHREAKVWRIIGIAGAVLGVAGLVWGAAK
jgi:chromosome segregation ATPase